LIFLGDFFLDVVGVVFVGVFEKIRCLDVVDLWRECGVLRGGCGVLDFVFWGSKKMPGLGDLFLQGR
jgi:hypothetical protein